MKNSKVSLIVFLLLALCVNIFSQSVTTIPAFPSVNDSIVVSFNIAECSNQSLMGYTGDVYVHTGVKIKSSTQWEHVIAEWNVNINKAKCTRISTNIYQIVLKPTVMEYYGIPSTDTVTDIAFVVRSSDGSKQSEDILVPVYQPGLTVELTNPSTNLIVTKGTNVDISAQTVRIGTPKVDSIILFLDNILIHTSKNDTLFHPVIAADYGLHWIKINAVNSEYSVLDSAYFFVRKEVQEVELPKGLENGINYVYDTSATLVLYAPEKESVFVIGDFNDWQIDTNYQMNKTPDGKRWWISLDSLTAGEEYAYQYYIDDGIIVADPYTEKILDPVNDTFITESTYPLLKEYPYGKTTGIASILQTAQEKYIWRVNEFVPPEKENLVIYELHVQNFTDAGNIKTITDSLSYFQRLGINAIELMPVNEFEGNLSWGYNPSFYFAFDKTYGTKTDFKEFVDSCHARGIAVIIDMVLNHSYSQSPLVRMYWDGSNVTKNNPWYNSTCPHSAYCWGFDFNHKSDATRYFVNRVLRHWLQEYKVDGYRFDFTKGFTNTVDQYANGPDTMRIAILKRMADSIWDCNNKTIVIFEHLADNSEETQLSDYGILLWGNMNYRYNEATMGYNDYENGGYKSDLTWGSYQARNWNHPSLVAYMESHDEERLMYKNKIYGNSNGIYDIKKTETGLQRIEAAAAFFFTIPGPKMIWEFGELGYDYSINTCTDGTVDDCRLDLKPIRWDYYDTISRYRLFTVYKALIDFKKLSICSTNDYNINVERELKKIHLNSSDTNITIIGNFGITNDSIVPEFQHTGTWYDYMTGTALEVTGANTKIKLKPGEYHIYSDIKLETPDLADAPVIPDVPLITIESLIDTQYDIFPNPSTDGRIILKYENVTSEKIGVRFVNVTGKVIYERNVMVSGNGEYNIDLSIVNPQLLFYEIVTPKDTKRGKLLIN